MHKYNLFNFITDLAKVFIVAIVAQDLNSTSMKLYAILLIILATIQSLGSNLSLVVLTGFRHVGELILSNQARIGVRTRKEYPDVILEQAELTEALSKLDSKQILLQNWSTVAINIIGYYLLIFG